MGMKAMARSYMCWPGMDADIESIATSCVSSRAVKSAARDRKLHCTCGCGQQGLGNVYMLISRDPFREKCSF